MAQYICIGQNVWGRGDTVAAAKRAAAREGRLNKLWVVYEYPDGTNPRVDPGGTGIYFEVPEGASEDDCHGTVVAHGEDWHDR